jgi:DNA-binding MarR family transcriptional regulator
MAEVVAELRSDGLVDRTPDSTDRRQLLVALTEEGREFVKGERRRREDWLSQAIADEFTPKEQAVLVESVALLRRLAEL